MFNIGTGEIIVIVIAILIFIKPGDLPAFLRKVGQLLGQLKGFAGAVNRQIRQAEYSLQLQESKDQKPVDKREMNREKPGQTGNADATSGEKQERVNYKE